MLSRRVVAMILLTHDPPPPLNVIIIMLLTRPDTGPCANAFKYMLRTLSSLRIRRRVRVRKDFFWVENYLDEKDNEEGEENMVVEG